MKRLLCILSNMNAGGAETFMMKIYRSIDRNNYQMDFCISVKEKCFYEDEIIDKGGKIFRIPSRSESIIDRNRQLKRIIKDNQYKYVLEVASNPMSFLDLWVAKKSQVEICSFRSSNSNDTGGTVSKMLNRVCRKLFMRYVDQKIAPSDLAAIYTFGKQEYENGKVKILKNGLDPEVYAFSFNARQAIRKEFGIKNDEFIVGHIGRFNTQKNHIFLIDIFKEFVKKHPNSKLLLVGDGSLVDSIREKINALSLNEKVIFTGVRTDIPNLLSAMDVFVFPSLYEGMPNTVIEAQACGLPCLISDTITKEANCFGLVRYCSLKEPSTYWAEEIDQIKDCRMHDTKKLIIESGYNIESIAQTFTEIVFHSGRNY